MSKAEEKKAEAALSDAAASTDPRVHQALAELEIAERNEDKDAIKAAKETLAELETTL